MTELDRDTVGDLPRRGVLDPAHIAGLAFFARRGMALQTPLLTMSGSVPREEELAHMAAGDYRFATTILDPIEHRDAIAALDREIRGCVRPLDHQYFVHNAHGVAFYLRNEFVGYVYVWPSGRIGPLCAFSPGYLVQLFAFALATLAKVYNASWCTMLVPGTNLRVVRSGLRAGLKIEHAGLFASQGSTLDLSRYVGCGRLLF